MEAITKRYDFVLFFDVKDGNPNGDPDAGNLPRLDAETGKGIVTDVCLKRKVRNYVLLTKKEERPYDIFIKEKAVLNLLIDEAHTDELVAKKEKNEKTESARAWMCKNYYDVRTFGAVMSTGKNAGQVRGPVQITFARSVDPVVALEHSITRVAKTTEERAEAGGAEMGRKYTVPYGLYRTHGFISAHLAEQTGFSIDDLELFLKALLDMFEHDRSAARGLMSTRKLIVFEHASALGNKPAHELFERVTHRRTTEGPARDFSDYKVLLDNEPIEETFKTVKII
ncbi:MAG: type I-C CRISPR-associated protein Cas7/Csd2 [Calditrichaeota bacterium]|nr:type I-C CRISPR-associated protein Cas7/Csd2 [Calditrichota bacterium]